MLRPKTKRSNPVKKSVTGEGRSPPIPDAAYAGPHRGSVSAMNSSQTYQMDPKRSEHSFDDVFGVAVERSFSFEMPAVVGASNLAEPSPPLRATISSAKAAVDQQSPHGQKALKQTISTASSQNQASNNEAGAVVEVIYHDMTKKKRNKPPKPAELSPGRQSPTRRKGSKQKNSYREKTGTMKSGFTLFGTMRKNTKKKRRDTKREPQISSYREVSDKEKEIMDAPPTSSIEFTEVLEDDEMLDEAAGDGKKHNGILTRLANNIAHMGRRGSTLKRGDFEDEPRIEYYNAENHRSLPSNFEYDKTLYNSPESRGRLSKSRTLRMVPHPPPTEDRYLDYMKGKVAQQELLDASVSELAPRFPPSPDRVFAAGRQGNNDGELYAQHPNAGLSQSAPLPPARFVDPSFPAPRAIPTLPPRVAPPTPPKLVRVQKNPRSIDEVDNIFESMGNLNRVPASLNDGVLHSPHFLTTRNTELTQETDWSPSDDEVNI